MQLLAAVNGDAGTPLVEALIRTAPRIRHGMTAVIITGSQDTVWVRLLASLRRRGINAVVVSLDQLAFRQAFGTTDAAADLATGLAQRSRALLHTLSEFQIAAYRVAPGRDLGEQLAS